MARELRFQGLVKRHFMLALALLSGALPLRSATLERLSLDDMIAQSTAIVRGKVSGSFAAFDGRTIYTHYRIQVSERLKGSELAEMDVAMPGGAVNGLRQTFPGVPALEHGREYLLFLWTGRSGLTRVIGLSQGLFSLAPGASSDPMAVRTVTGERMVAPGTGMLVRDEGLRLRLSQLRNRIANAAGSRSGLK